ncbi:Primosomal protein DnaI [subsurface metagenome]
MTFENFKVCPELQEAYDLALQLAEGGDVTWLTMMSGTMRGKTHLAIAICRRWLESEKPAKYAYVPLLFEELRRGFREEGDRSYEARFDRFLNVPLLVLDDLGTENRTPWVQEKLDTIIDYRLSWSLPLVVTTNTPMDELPFRITSRLGRLPSSRVVFINAPEFTYIKKGL